MTAIVICNWRDVRHPEAGGIAAKESAGLLQLAVPQPATVAAAAF